MEDEILNNGEPVDAARAAPKKRGRKPKNQAESPSAEPAKDSAPKKRAGRPRKVKTQETPDVAQLSPEVQGESSGAPVDIIEAAKQQKRRGRKPSLKREDGPVWRDEENVPDDAQYDAGQTEIFEHKDARDDFAYYAAPSEPEPRNDSDSDADFSPIEKSFDDDEIPTSFSTSDEDLNPDSYRDMFEDESGDYSGGASADESAAELPSENSFAARSDSDEGNRERRERWNSQNQGGGQNRQGGNNRWQNNRNQNQGGGQNRQGGNNRWQNNRNQQGNQNRGSQQNNRNQPNNRNQQNNRNNQPNNQNRNNQQNAQNLRKAQQQKRKPRWMQNQSPEDDLMNPADLPEWDALKSQESLDSYLARTFLGASIAGDISASQVAADSQGSLSESPAENIVSADLNLGLEPTDETASETGANLESPEASSPRQDVPEKEKNESEPEEIVSAERELADIASRKSISDMSYWELMANANDSNVVHAPKPQVDSQPETLEVPSSDLTASEKTEPPSENLPAASQKTSEEHFALSDVLVLDGVGEIGSMDGFDALYGLQTKEIQKSFDDMGVAYRRGVGKSELIADYYKYAAQNKKLVKVNGVLDVFEDGFGGAIAFEADSYKLRRMSVYVPQMFIEKYALKRGHEICALAMPPREDGKESCPIAVKILSVMGGNPETARNVTPFTDLTPYYPTRRIIMEATDAGWDNLSMRAVDLLTPIGFGQRALIVAPPRTGKTVLMQGMAKSIRLNAPDAHLMILLVDERPEEVTDFKRSVDAEVIASTFDEDALSHVHAAEMVISRARRMVECGKDVVILLDSITRLARAYNALMPNGGRTMSGGVEANALQKPKKFFGSARNIEGGGSLTIIGTALIETGSKMDEVIFEEFKGTGNLELHLDRALSDKRIFPSINIEKSGTRKEELLYHPDELTKIYALRRAMKGVPAADAMEMLVQRLKKVKTNVEFLIGLNR